MVSQKTKTAKRPLASVTQRPVLRPVLTCGWKRFSGGRGRDYCGPRQEKKWLVTICGDVCL